jgi:Ca2+-binding RTX toxin-like protein
MADNVYVVDQLVTGTATITQDDDGSGIDTIDLGGIHDAGSSIDLSWEVLAGVSVSGEGIYFTNGNEGHRLVVNGFIENARGSNGSDFIAGNEGANFLEGDQLDTGPGGNNTIGGDEGNDTIFGGAGNDNIGGAEDDDILSETQAMTRSAAVAGSIWSSAGPGLTACLAGPVLAIRSAIWSRMTGSRSTSPSALPRRASVGMPRVTASTDSQM